MKSKTITRTITCVKHMVNRITLTELLLTLFLCSCRPDADTAGRNDVATQQPVGNSQSYLRSLLRVGESREELVREFGPPLGEYKTKSNELCLYFHFSGHNQTPAARSAGVGGFTAFCVNNKLVHWVPIYESKNPVFKNSSFEHAPVAFKSSHPVLMISIISHHQKNGWVYINNHMFPKLGYIRKIPDITIYSGQYNVYGSRVNMKHAVELLLSEEDGNKLHILTSQNVGRQIAMLVDTQVIFAPYVQEPLSNGQVTLVLPDQSFKILLRALKDAQQN